jgi:predicted phosphodiesterase
VPKATREETERVVFLSDTHFPFHEQSLVESSLRFVKKLKPHRVVLNGDVNDFFQLSRFNTGLERLDTLQDELDLGNGYRANLRKAAPNAVIDETTGNHDDRIISYVQQNGRALTSLRALEPARLLNHKDLGINHHPGAGFLLRPNFLVKHGTLIRKHAGWSAKAELEAAGVSGISGHTHRLCTYRAGGLNPLSWTEQGGLMRLDPDYITGVPSWQQGAAVGFFSTKTNSFLIEEVQAVDGKLFYGGRSL